MRDFIEIFCAVKLSKTVFTYFENSTIILAVFEHFWCQNWRNNKRTLKLTNFPRRVVNKTIRNFFINVVIMSRQILYLFDLDQCIPLEEKLESETLECCISQVKDVCSRILSSASHLDGPNMEHRNTAHFSFKFYSSTGYFLVPDNHGEGGGGVKFDTEIRKDDMLVWAEGAG